MSNHRHQYFLNVLLCSSLLLLAVVLALVTKRKSIEASITVAAGGVAAATDAAAAHVAAAENAAAARAATLSDLPEVGEEDPDWRPAPGFYFCCHGYCDADGKLYPGVQGVHTFDHSSAHECKYPSAPNVDHLRMKDGGKHP